ncbi:YicC/YloC family endoribonuclease [Guggenheimella bovis]
MIQSMTGYGKHQLENEHFTLKLELRSVNSRFLEMNFRMPKLLFPYEDLLRKSLSKRLNRGKVDCFIDFKLKGNDAVSVTVDHVLLNKYHKAYQEIQDALQRDDVIGISQYFNIPNLITVEGLEADEEVVKDALFTALNGAIDGLLVMREKEAVHLVSDIEERLKEMEVIKERIRSIYPETMERAKARFEERINELLSDHTLDPFRLEEEIAIMLDKRDVEEEMTRITSHIEQMRQTLTVNEPIGRKLDFICQELNREINTTGSKSTELEITNAVVELKTLLEQIREQVQNLE